MWDLTKGSPIKKIIMFTIPLLIGNLFQQLYNVADTIIVGRTISIRALAAVGATDSLFALIIGFAQGMTAGLTILTARRHGADDYSGVKRSFAVNIIISTIVSLILTLIGVLFARPILVLMQTPYDIIDDAQKFIVACFWGISVTVLYNLFNNALRSLGNSRAPLIFLALACVVNIVFDFIFILFFHMGVAGAGYASVAAQGLSALWCLHFIKRFVPELTLSRSDFAHLFREVKPHLQLGLPMGFQTSIISIGAIIVQVMLNTLGSNAVAAYTTAGRIDFLATQISLSFGITMATYAAQNLGARQYARIRKGVHQAMALSCVLSVVIGVLIITFAIPLCYLFVGGEQPGIVHLAQIYFLCNSTMYALLSLLLIIRYTLQGLGHSFLPTLSGLIELFMRSFAVTFLIKFWGFAGASLANPLAWCGGLLILIGSYISVSRKLKAREASQPAYKTHQPQPEAY
ncbi:MATE family efflux transporter [Sporolactobacillus shoreicorticis]|uniref:MATE family efflux transporter n=1 Tax=Sporolactobacillus shoreicorticis TaxID=1923877 RepID=A0ABW5S3X2_9BACL|nr:MATE family efflux transporter [Sporolactobacillus shoreicorticis]MCO7124344.1 MATE family efflux transporter [Sporolactobacillus shoreicorticis]